MKLKRSLLLLAFAFCWVACVEDSTATVISIADVNIEPEEPLLYDIITISASGQTASMGNEVDHTEFSIVDMYLQLDLFFDLGELHIVGPWSYSEDIAPLDAGTYTLTVRAFDWPNGGLEDTYITSFTVVPEPATLVLLASGIMGIRVCRHRHSGNPCIEGVIIV